MIYRLTLHDDALKDLRDLKAHDPTTAATIEATLEQIEADPHLLESLTDHNFGERSDKADFHVSKWNEFWKRGKDLWRIKVWSLEKAGIKYRIFYAYLPRTQVYCVLGIIHRSKIDYDNPGPLGQRILDAYRDLDG